MAGRETLRDLIAGDLDDNLIKQRQAAGWRMVALLWERENVAAMVSDVAEPPYGLQVARDCHHLEENPEEAAVLKIVMRMVVQDKPLSTITDELNAAGHRTRAGNPWTIVEVFRLMPALVDRGPRMFADPGWPAMRGA
jgi:hypothetical protein